DTHLRTEQGTVYKGTLLEHLLVQNLVASLNVGSHNNLRLEDADWNDGLDMAKENGESVAFTAFYGKNLIDMAELLKTFGGLGLAWRLDTPAGPTMVALAAAAFAATSLGAGLGAALRRAR
ncbi:MAG: hypothetical protein R6V44_01285, partial [Paracoccaceae bacterium]